MASRVPKFSVEELQRAMQGPNIGQALATGFGQFQEGESLARTIEEKKLEKQKKLLEIQQLVAKMKGEKEQSEKELRFADTLQGPTVARIGGQEVKAAETRSLAPEFAPLGQGAKAFPKEAFNLLSDIKKEQTKPTKAEEPTKLQRLGLIKSGQTVSFNPISGQNILETGEVYSPQKHGQIMREQAPQLSPELTKDLVATSDSLADLQRAKSAYKPTLTGPIQSRANALYEATGINLTGANPADVSKFRVDAFTAINNYIKAVTGAQMSEPEARRIQKALFRVNGIDESFEPAINEALNIVESKLNKKLDFYESQGYRGMREARPILGGKGVTPPQDLSSLSDEELDAQISALQGNK